MGSLDPIGWILKVIRSRQVPSLGRQILFVPPRLLNPAGRCLEIICFRLMELWSREFQPDGTLRKVDYDMRSDFHSLMFV